MKHIEDLLLLGDERLYQKCESVKFEELSFVKNWVLDLAHVMTEIQQKYNFGRGIAAPQLGIMKRLVYIRIDRPIIMINPVLKYKSELMFNIWDDCMSFPQLLVLLERHQQIEIEYKDENWKTHTLKAEGDLSELIQHEVDHLDGILCIDRALNQRSFKWRVFR